MTQGQKALVVLVALVTPALLYFMAGVYHSYLQKTKKFADRCAGFAIIGSYLVIGYVTFELAVQMNCTTFGFFFNIAIPYGLVPIFLIPLGVNLYLKWVKAELTEEEKLPGIVGIRAWLSPGNLICCFGAAFFNQIGYHNRSATSLYFWFYFLLLILIILAYPLINTKFLSRPKIQNNELSHVKLKIIQMLSDGKITFEQSKELLDALHYKNAE